MQQTTSEDDIFRCFFFLCALRVRLAYILFQQDQKVRLETFSDWPSSAPVKQHVLAQEGFYYLNEGDKVKCAFCNLLLHSWKAKQSPRDLHKQRNPNCPFLNKKEGHVPKFVRSTRHPMYGRYERRLATFVSWPLNAYVSAEALADAGLFYRGKQHLFSHTAYVLIVSIYASRSLYFLSRTCGN